MRPQLGKVGEVDRSLLRSHGCWISGRIRTAGGQGTGAVQQLATLTTVGNTESETGSPWVERLEDRPMGRNHQGQGSRPMPLSHPASIVATGRLGMAQQHLRRRSHKNQGFIGRPALESPDVTSMRRSNGEPWHGVGGDHRRTTLKKVVCQLVGSQHPGSMPAHEQGESDRRARAKRLTPSRSRAARMELKPAWFNRLSTGAL